MTALTVPFHVSIRWWRCCRGCQTQRALPQRWLSACHPRPPVPRLWLSRLIENRVRTRFFRRRGLKTGVSLVCVGHSLVCVGLRWWRCSRGCQTRRALPHGASTTRQPRTRSIARCPSSRPRCVLGIHTFPPSPSSQPGAWRDTKASVGVRGGRVGNNNLSR